MNPIEITRNLTSDLQSLHFSPPVTHVYHPLLYARKAHEQYLQRYGQGCREILLLGMNPGPWGMAQTGVPFGDIVMVREWMGIEAEVDQPPVLHPKRPITGFRCTRREVSGSRLWGWAQDRFHTPEKFFSRFFVINYCPLAFFLETGGNLTPDKIAVAERNSLQGCCDWALQQFVEYYQPSYVIGIGGFAEKSAQRALAGKNIRIERIPHPSPANPGANRGWQEAAETALQAMGIRFYSNSGLRG